MKKYIIIWSIVIVLLFSTLTIFGFKYKKIIKYKKMEESMVNIAKEYVKNNNIKINKNIMTINLTKLLEYNLDLQDKIVKDKCNGKVVITKGLIKNKFKAKITCKNYQTT